MGKNNINLGEYIKSQLETEQTELLDLIGEIEYLSKMVDEKMTKINEKQKNITILETLNKMCNYPVL